MTGRPSDGPLIWNVTGLLGESPGAERILAVTDVEFDLGLDVRLAAPIQGRVRIVRTNRGILVHADLHAALSLVCSRCLRDLAVPVEVRLDEEVLPALELATGRPLSTADEPDVARLTEHHELDLDTLVREAFQLAEPIAPLCREDCPGLCIACGERLDEGAHNHPDEAIDPRLEALRGFRRDNDA